MRHFFLFLILTLSIGCSGLEQTEYQNVRKRNEKGEYIYRKSDEKYASPGEVIHRMREKYPWEKSVVGNHPRITKEYFRCRGSTQNPQKLEVKENDETVYYRDCNGAHSLPIHNEKEFIYPILLNLLNFVQKETKQPVVITSAHRCPTHNSYCDSSKSNRTSKHMVGAEVDFYVQGMEKQSERVIELLKKYFIEKEEYKDQESYQNFKEYSGETNVSIPPIFNKEVFIKHFQKEEGRDFDNRHTYPYISIQVRYDRQLKKRVSYTWEQAFHNYFRW